MFFNREFWRDAETAQGAAETLNGAVDQAKAAARLAERVRCQRLIRGELEALAPDDPARDVLTYLSVAVNQGWHRPGGSRDVVK